MSVTTATATTILLGNTGQCMSIILHNAEYHGIPILHD